MHPVVVTYPTNRRRTPLIVMATVFGGFAVINIPIGIVVAMALGTVGAIGVAAATAVWIGLAIACGWSATGAKGARRAGKPFFGVSQDGVVLGPSFTIPWSEVTDLHTRWDDPGPSTPTISAGARVADAMIDRALDGGQLLTTVVRVRDWEALRERAYAVDREIVPLFTQDGDEPAVVVQCHPLGVDGDIRALGSMLSEYGTRA